MCGMFRTYRGTKVMRQNDQLIGNPTAYKIKRARKRNEAWGKKKGYTHVHSTVGKYNSDTYVTTWGNYRKKKR